MKRLLDYLRSRLLAAGMFCVLFGLMAAALALYGLPLAAVGYAALLCLFTGGVFAALDGARYLRRRKRLAALAEDLRFLPEGLPEPGDALERNYQALLEALRAEAARAEEENGRRFRDLTDYYTIWAHQIKTPIAAMELMLQKDAAPDPAALREQLRRIEQYVEMALGYLRLDSESTDLVLGTYDLDDILRPAVKKYAAQFIRRRISLSYEPLRVQVLTDEKWLRFVVEQVLSNALKYTPRGTISITLEPEKTLVIRDTGIGIRPEDLPRIFQKGFTGANGRTDRKATGLGLYLCRRTCAMLGHTIAVESAPGRGTAVRIGLSDQPLAAE